MIYNKRIKNPIERVIIMNREMQKKDRQTSLARAKEMLAACTEGTLAMHGDDGYPYSLPMNYIYMNDVIYMHSADKGYKIDALRANQKVGFSVIVRSEIAPELFTTKFESVVATGDLSFVEDDAERQQVMEAIVSRFSPGLEEGGMKFIRAAIHRTAILKIQIREMKGKAFRADTMKK